MKDVTVETWWAKIYISGPIEIAKQVCREECLREGLCVTVDPTTFIYTGGEEVGVVVGLINYPRFPSAPDTIDDRAVELALKLMRVMCQQSVMLMTPKRTWWRSLRD